MPEDRRLAAIMFTDIVGYTALIGSNEDKAFDILANYHTIHSTLIKKQNDTHIKEAGHGTLVSFSLASDAVRWAMDIRQSIHFLGEIKGEITTDDLLGNIFSRFCIGT